MPKEYKFTIKHFPVNDLWELDLGQHMNQIAEDAVPRLQRDVRQTHE